MAGSLRMIENYGKAGFRPLEEPGKWMSYGR